MFYSIWNKIDRLIPIFVWIENIFLPVFYCGTGEPSFTRIIKSYMQVIEKVLVSRIFFLIYSYLPVINPSSPAGGESYFPQQFQHSTPTTPLRRFNSLRRNAMPSMPKLSRWFSSFCDFCKKFPWNCGCYRRRFVW